MSVLMSFLPVLGKKEKKETRRKKRKEKKREKENKYKLFVTVCFAIVSS